MPEFSPDRYDENGIYIPRLYGQPWRYWYKTHGLKNVAEIRAYVVAHGIRMEGRDDDLLEWRDVKLAGIAPTNVQP